MRTATIKNTSANTNKATSKSAKAMPKTASSNQVAKPMPKAVIEKLKPQGIPTPPPVLKTPNKQSRLIALLQEPKGADIKMLTQATDWQAHSIRGFISGILRKKLGLNVVSSKVDGVQHYRIEQQKLA